MEIIVNRLKELSAAAKSIIDFLGTPSIVFLEAEMGAGKTTLVSEICRQLGVTEITSSPTFSLVNIYTDSNGREIYHLDLYRLGSEEEFLEAGLEEYLHRGNWVFIEWPELAIPFIEIPFRKISISQKPDGKRIINIL
nr:tRNA (adenosine(37)-N6)-threonylcarbamoyltransferase complex ATPase subunit type 1 TsaE [Saprospiraceae bacterium]